MAGTVLDLDVWVEGRETPISVRADQRDMIAFELHYKTGTAKALENMTILFLNYVAWAALRRTGETEQVYGEWAKNVIAVEEADSDEGGLADPGSPAA